MKNIKIKKYSIILENNLITNFKPSFLPISKDVNIFKSNKKQIFCKNFLIFILLIKYNKKFNININTKIFIKKQKNKIYTIIRSPYRHKLARHQIGFNRFFIKVVFILKLNKLIKIKNYSNIIKIVKSIKKINSIFETNIISLENIKLNFPFIFVKNFKIKNFWKNTN